ncbi:MAG TPA: response regulator transcription factor [Firmicutes bacterium]|nr:response regulator transcription factor [Bacillota bacterium]
MRLLVVEDEPDLAQVVVRRLKEAGYAVDLARDGEEALDFLAAVRYDCVILDQLLPKQDGRSVLKALRSRGDNTPVLILTALDALEDKVKGLDAGADDYLTKPFAFEELLARVRALLRRSGEEHRGPILTVADLELNTVTHQVTRDGQEIKLTAKEYALLEYLMRHPNQVLSRSQIAEHVWDYDFTGLSNVVDVYIRYLRRKVDDGFEPKLIQTVRGTGYQLRAPE